MQEHLLSVAEITQVLASKIGLGDFGYIIGLNHDLGKAGKQFQNYLLSANGLIDPDNDAFMDPISSKGTIDHSSAGAQWLFRSCQSLGSSEGKILGQAFALCIASHHSGLIDNFSPNGDDLFTKRMKKVEESTSYQEAVSFLEEKLLSSEEKARLSFDPSTFIQKLKDLKEISSTGIPLDSQQSITFKTGLLLRFLFSCLLDADRLDTAAFEDPGKYQLRNQGKYATWDILINRFETKLTGIKQTSVDSYINQIRNDISQRCFEFASKARGFFQLNVPTGGGKTLSSLRFALHHAKKYNLEHIFYIVPYTSIIDQNAEEVRKILEDKDSDGRYLNKIVLEHHSNLTPENETMRQNLLAENWDAPIIFTTQVQFLETLFSDGTRSARRFHQLANSVIIFDEVQTIPISCIYMFNLAVRFLVHSCGSSVVLCTATQPLLDEVEPTMALPLNPSNQIIQNAPDLYMKMKRTEAIDCSINGGWTDIEIADFTIEQTHEFGSVLVITNTKKSAANLYFEISKKSSIEVFHLSTNMCPAHRLDKLSEIKERLISGIPIICVSTQLIEGGVDIDFGCVIRFQAGLDSIVQAAGRCNRNGNRKNGKVFVINPANENIDRLKDIRKGREETLRILSEIKRNPERFNNDLIGLETIKQYYQYYFSQRENDMAYHVSSNSDLGHEDTLFNLFSLNSIATQEYKNLYQKDPPFLFRQSFKTAGKLFSVIDQVTQGIIVPYKEEGNEVITDLCSIQFQYKKRQLLKKAQRYSINQYSNLLNKLITSEIIHETQPDSGIYYLQSPYYHPDLGFYIEGEEKMETLFF